jgi:uncharacterized protein YfaQ (DUF2300 family)
MTDMDLMAVLTARLVKRLQDARLVPQVILKRGEHGLVAKMDSQEVEAVCAAAILAEPLLKAVVEIAVAAWAQEGLRDEMVAAANARGLHELACTAAAIAGKEDADGR